MKLTKAEWRVVGHLLATRSGPRCECCGADLRGVPRDDLEIQHRRARGMGGTDLEDANNLANLLLFDRRCHRWVESRPTVVVRDRDTGADVKVDAASARGLWMPHEYDDGVPRQVHEVPLVLWSGRRVFLDPVSAPYVDHPDQWGFPGPLVTPSQ